VGTEGWTSIAEYDIPLPVPVTWRLNFETTLAEFARRFIPEAIVRVRPHATPPWGSPVGQPALLRCIHLQRRCIPHTHPRNLRPIGVATHATSLRHCSASQGEGNNLEVWYATATVAYHQGAEVRHGERPIGTEQAGNLVAARALESAATLAQLRLASRREANPRQPHRLHK
jgi:hypothetical protein